MAMQHFLPSWALIVVSFGCDTKVHWFSDTLLWGAWTCVIAGCGTWGRLHSGTPSQRISDSGSKGHTDIMLYYKEWATCNAIATAGQIIGGWASVTFVVRGKWLFIMVKVLCPAHTYIWRYDMSKHGVKLCSKLLSLSLMHLCTLILQTKNQDIILTGVWKVECSCVRKGQEVPMARILFSVMVASTSSSSSTTSFFNALIATKLSLLPTCLARRTCEHDISKHNIMQYNIVWKAEILFGWVHMLNYGNVLRSENNFIHVII